MSKVTPIASANPGYFDTLNHTLNPKAFIFREFEKSCALDRAMQLIARRIDVRI